MTLILFIYLLANGYTMVHQLRNLSYSDRLRRLNLPSLEDRSDVVTLLRNTCV